MNKKKLTIILSLVLATSLTGCNKTKQEAKLKPEQLIPIIDNLKVDNVEDPGYKEILLEKESVIEKTKDGKALKRSGFAKLPSDVEFGIPMKDTKVYKKTNSQEDVKQLFDVDWNYMVFENEFEKVDSVMYSKDIKYTTKTLEKEAKFVEDLNNKILSETKGLRQTYNPNIKLNKDNTYLKKFLAADLSKEGEKDKFDFAKIKKQLDDNKSAMFFEGEDFYMFYDIYNNVKLEVFSLKIMYISKNEAHGKNNFTTGAILTIESFLEENNEENPFIKIYRDPNGTYTQYSKSEKASDTEKDIMNYLVKGGDTTNTKEKETYDKDDKQAVEDILKEEYYKQTYGKDYKDDETNITDDNDEYEDGYYDGYW